MNARQAPSIERVLDAPTFERLAAVWGRYPLLQRGDPDRYRELIDDDVLSAALESGLPRIGALHSLDPDEPLTSGHTETISADAVDSFVERGHTICVTNLSAAVPELAELARQFVGRMGLLSEARFNSFLSPPGSGADVHLDARVTISMQVQGRKRWWYGSAPALLWPRSNAQLLPDGTPVWMFPWCGADSWEQLAPVQLSDLNEVVLEPGDLLCLPAGTWHAAKALERSFALNLSVSGADPATIIGNLIARELEADPSWRGGLAPSPGTGGTFEVPLRAQLAEMLKSAERVLARTADELAPIESEWTRLWGRPRQ